MVKEPIPEDILTDIKAQITETLLSSISLSIDKDGFMTSLIIALKDALLESAINTLKSEYGITDTIELQKYKSELLEGFDNVIKNYQ